MQRRDFLATASRWLGLGLAALLPFGAARLLAPASASPPQARPGQRNYLRPPGAKQDDAAFIQACIGCGNCAEVCPPRCIRFHARDGGERLNLPYIDAQARACTLCGKCMAVCPTDALTVTRRREIDMGIAQIDRSACYPWVDTGVCGACVSVCPLGEHAIGFKMWNQYRPVVHDGCVGCGLCVEVCPHPSKPIWIVAREQGSVARHSL